MTDSNEKIQLAIETITQCALEAQEYSDIDSLRFRVFIALGSVANAIEIMWEHIENKDNDKV